MLFDIQRLGIESQPWRSDTTKIVSAQLTAMGAGRDYDIGLRDESTGKFINRTWTYEHCLVSINWLKRMNLNNHHVYVRPVGDSSLTMLDDLDIDLVNNLYNTGLQPAVVVETSPFNYQVWLNHSQVLSPNESTAMARMLAGNVGSDISSATRDHFGRLAGFTNRKFAYRQSNGLFPFCKLIAATGCVYERVDEVMKDMRLYLEKQTLDDQLENQLIADHLFSRGGQCRVVKPITFFHAKYSDLHRADMAWAKHAALMGLDFQAIFTAIFTSRDLSKKGDVSRQRDYAKRTANKALAYVQNLSVRSGGAG